MIRFTEFAWGRIWRRNWCRRGESNPRPRDYETLALPLSYAGIMQSFMLRTPAQKCQALSVRREDRFLCRAMRVKFAGVAACTSSGLTARNDDRYCEVPIHVVLPYR